MNLNFESRLIAALASIIGLFGAQVPLYSTWEPPVIVSDPRFPATFLSGPVLKVSPQGNAISIWTTDNSETFPPPTERQAIFSSFYTRGVGWSPPQAVSSFAMFSDGGAIYLQQGDPDIAFNSTGYAVAVWEGVFFTPNSSPLAVFTATRSSNGIWGPVEILGSEDDGFGAAANINVSMNEAGTALAAWTQSGPRFTDPAFKVVRFLPFGGSWSAPYYFPDQGTELEDTKPYPFINPTGNAVVTWRAVTPEPEGYEAIAATIYNADTATWSTPILFDIDSTRTQPPQPNPRCSMDAAGHAVVAWIVQVGPYEYAARAAYYNGTSWELPVTLGAAGQFNENEGASVVMDLSGNATAVWTGPNALLSQSVPGFVYASSRLQDGTWTTPQAISSLGLNHFRPFMSQEPLSVDPEGGDVIATWLDATQDSIDATPDSIKAAIKPFGEPWLPEETVFQEEDAGYLNVGIASCGFAIALWQGGLNSVSVVKAAIRENFIVPHNARGSRCCDKFAMQKICMNILNWDPNDCVSVFNIYRDGVLIASVPNSQVIKYVDPLGCKRSNHVYTITAVSNFGFEGEPVPVVFN